MHRYGLVTNKTFRQKTGCKVQKHKKTEVPKMTSKVVSELFLRSFEQFKFSRKTGTKVAQSGYTKNRTIFIRKMK